MAFLARSTRRRATSGSPCGAGSPPPACRLCPRWPSVRRSSRRSARFLRIGDVVGTVEREKIADLVLVDADPLVDITTTRRIAAVIVRGRYYDSGGLVKIRAQVLAAPDITVDDWGRK